MSEIPSQPLVSRLTEGLNDVFLPCSGNLSDKQQEEP